MFAIYLCCVILKCTNICIIQNNSHIYASFFLFFFYRFFLWSWWFKSSYRTFVVLAIIMYGLSQAKYFFFFFFKQKKSQAKYLIKSQLSCSSHSAIFFFNFTIITQCSSKEKNLSIYFHESNIFSVIGQIRCSYNYFHIINILKTK